MSLTLLTFCDGIENLISIQCNIYLYRILLQYWGPIFFQTEVGVQLLELFCFNHTCSHNDQIIINQIPVIARPFNTVKKKTKTLKQKKQNYLHTRDIRGLSRAKMLSTSMWYALFKCLMTGSGICCYHNQCDTSYSQVTQKTKYQWIVTSEREII